IVTTLDIRTEDIEQRLKRFSSLLDESLEGATGQAREIARVIAESSSQGATALESERRRTLEAINSIQTQQRDTLDTISTDYHQTVSSMTTEQREALRGIYNEQTSQTHEL